MRRPAALVVVATALALTSACASHQLTPNHTHDEYVTKADLQKALDALKDESQFVRGMGFLRLEKQGADCRVTRETKVTVRAYPGATVYWLIDNQCGSSVKLTTADRKKADPNNTNPKVDDPFNSPPENPTTPVGTSIVSGVIKTLTAFNPDDKTKVDKFKFKWQVNGKNQPDPEIEIDYRRR